MSTSKYPNTYPLDLIAREVFRDYVGCAIAGPDVEPCEENCPCCEDIIQDLQKAMEAVAAVSVGMVMAFAEKCEKESTVAIPNEIYDLAKYIQIRFNLIEKEEEDE